MKPDSQFFRQSFGELVPSLCRKFGYDQVQRVEDAVQTAMLRAVEHWARKGQPQHPKAWLYRSACNVFIDEYRKTQRQTQLVKDFSFEPNDAVPSAEDTASFSGSIDDTLRMLFVVCDPKLKVQSQIAFSLRVLCGMSVAEIANRLLTSEANIHQRMSRARKVLRARGKDIVLAPDDPTEDMRNTVLTTLYALFSEGYFSTSEDAVIQVELCDEAIRLTTQLADHAWGQATEVWALLALMHFHRSRFGARCGPEGELLLLEEQDRKLYDKSGIETGLYWLSKSAQGVPNRWHAEAGIAAEYCRAPDHQSVDWIVILRCYDSLVQLAPSVLVQLNRAVTLAEVSGPDAGLNEIAEIDLPSWLEGAWQLNVVKGQLLARSGEFDAAHETFRSAQQMAPNARIRQLIQKREVLELRDSDDPEK